MNELSPNNRSFKAVYSKFKITLLIPFLLLTGAVGFAQEQPFTNPIGMEFILIRPGSIIIGRYQPTVGKYQEPKASPRTPVSKVLPPAIYRLAEKMAKESAMAGFTVNINEPFYIGKFEVTQEQWKKVMGHNPSWFQDGKVNGDAKHHPVETITWKEALDFIKKLNKLDKEHAYRLPTEFEWEYAATAGAVDDISWSKAASMGVISDITTRAVGSKEPNAFGLYDMIGNVWEWVQDVYNEKIFADPVPPNKGKEHVLKGASFTGDAKNATYKTHAAGPGNGFDVGMRVVMEVR